MRAACEVVAWQLALECAPRIHHGRRALAGEIINGPSVATTRSLRQVSCRAEVEQEVAARSGDEQDAVHGVRGREEGGFYRRCLDALLLELRVVEDAHGAERHRVKHKLFCGTLTCSCIPSGGAEGEDARGGEDEPATPPLPQPLALLHAPHLVKHALAMAPADRQVFIARLTARNAAVRVVVVVGDGEASRQHRPMILNVRHAACREQLRKTSGRVCAESTEGGAGRVQPVRCEKLRVGPERQVQRANHGGSSYTILCESLVYVLAKPCTPSICAAVRISLGIGDAISRGLPVVGCVHSSFSACSA